MSVVRDRLGHDQPTGETSTIQTHVRRSAGRVASQALMYRTSVRRTCVQEVAVSAIAIPLPSRQASRARTDEPVAGPASGRGGGQSSRRPRLRLVTEDFVPEAPVRSGLEGAPRPVSASVGVAGGAAAAARAAQRGPPAPAAPCPHPSASRRCRHPRQCRQCVVPRRPWPYGAVARSWRDWPRSTRRCGPPGCDGAPSRRRIGEAALRVWARVSLSRPARGRR